MYNIKPSDIIARVALDEISGLKDLEGGVSALTLKANKVGKERKYVNTLKVEKTFTLASTHEGSAN